MFARSETLKTFVMLSNAYDHTSEYMPAEASVLSANDMHGPWGENQYLRSFAPLTEDHKRVCASRKPWTNPASAHHDGGREGGGFVSTAVLISSPQKPSWRVRPPAIRPCWNDLRRIRSKCPTADRRGWVLTKLRSHGTRRDLKRRLWSCWSRTQGLLPPYPHL